MTTTTVTPRRGVRGGRPLALLLAAAALTLVPRAARAGDQVPFRAAFATTFESDGDFPVAHISVAGLGRALHMGATTAVTTDQAVNVITGAATATYTLTAANGDTVVVALAFQTTFLPGGRVTFEGTYTVTGGTGRFAGATGRGTTAGTAVFLGPDGGVGEFKLGGTISN